MFRLCVALKIPHPDYLYEMLSPDQLNDWESFYTITGFDSDKDDARMGLFMSILQNIAIKTHGKTGSTLSKFSDFIFDWDITKPKEEKRQSVEEMKTILLSFASEQNKRVEKEEKLKQK